ncbi:clostripain-related cysteine peptidase [Marispirochaeta aestuarii]|uniref:clostripain-related cysteine peptidase n=1 Tax=Marispirochaeta aestuarii TaxID=1963862 RepID=UPI0029C8821A|nr:clostripain-related cysteine peptidase [Marispirochaeta aestuarii]
MKKNHFGFCLFTIFFTIVLFSCSDTSSSSPSVTEYPDRTDGSWLIIVHLGIDNNIDYEFEEQYGIMSNYVETLESLEANDTEEMLDIVVMMDCYNTDTQGTGYTSAFQDGWYHLSGGSFSDDLVTSKTEINSGDPLSSQSFMDWALTAVPDADYFVYSVFNHGSGFDDINEAGTYGIAFDDDGSNDSLSHSELGQLTAYLKSKIGKNIDLFFPYACLMGGVELAYEIKDSVDFLVFSEELFPAERWSWEAFDIILERPGISGANLGSAICTSAYNYFSNPGIDREFTLATIDLSKITPLVSALNSFASNADTYIGLDESRAALFDVCAYYSLAMNTLYYNDLKLFMSNVGYLIPSFSSYSTSVLNALDRAVIFYEFHGINYSYCGGLSIFHNLWVLQSGYNYEYPVSTYETILDFGTDTSWGTYLQTLDDLNILVHDNYEPDDNFTSAKSITVGAEPQYHTFDIPGESDYMSVNLTEGQTYTIQTYPATIPYADTYLTLYDSSETSLVENDDINVADGNYFSKVIFTPSISDTYYIECTDYYDYLGDYTIDIRAGSYSLNPEDYSFTKPTRKRTKIDSTALFDINE